MSAVLETREPSARYLGAVQPLLVRQFELLATAPGGMGRLRELILALAVQGKVVQQDPGDEPASELLRRIRLERTELVAAGSIKQGKPSTPVSPEEEPCPLPRGWAWVRFGDLIHELCTGPFGSLIHKEDYVYGGVPLINPSHMIDGRIEHDPAVSMSASMASQLSAYRLSAGDFLLARRGEMGRYALVTQREAGWLCGTGSFFLKLSEGYDRRFFGLTLEDPRLRRHLLGESVGATMTNLNQRILLDVVVAVAPLAEQARIVARVGELMRLCDALEAKGPLQAEQHARLLGTLLGTLTDSSTPEELAANWRRVANHFDLLLDRPEAVDALEQTVLQLAVRGLLVHQDPSDEPADDFLERLRDERLRLHEERRGKNDVRWSPVESGLYELPSGWTWTTIEQLAEVGTGTTPSRDNAAFFTGGTIPWVTSGETGQSFIRETAQHVTEVALAKTSLTVYPVGTLIVAMYGQGKTRGQVSELCLPATTNQACAAIVLMERSAVHRDFIKLVFEKSYDEIRELSAGGAQPNLNVGKVKTSLIPLPPLKEQARIVTRVSELRRLCADLRQRLDRSRTTQTSLADALVEQALSA